MIKLIANKEIREMVKNNELLVRFITTHHLDIGQYPIQAYIESKITEWSNGVAKYIITWCENNYSDIELFCSWATNQVTMQIIICWFIQFPSQEAKTHYQLSEVLIGGDWF